MPSSDLTLKARLINAGMPAGDAQDVANTIALSPISGATIDNTPIGATTPSTVKATDYQTQLTDISGTPGNGTASTNRGRAAFAASAAAVTVTSTLVTATSTVLASLETTDATLTFIKSIVPGAGSFVVTANATATGITKFSFVVFN